MNKGRVLNAEEALESGISLAKKAGKGVSKAVSDTAKAATSQVGISPQAADQSTNDFVKDLYGSTDDSKKQSQTQTPQGAGDDHNNPPKTPEEAEKQAEEKKKMLELRQKLHNEVYYDPLVNPRKDKPKERPAEKVEKEKQEEMIDLRKKEEKKPPPLAVQRGQRKTEQFPGGGG